jgi:hypothetical protein
MLTFAIYLVAVARAVLRGDRMPLADIVSLPMRDLIHDCWHQDSNARPVN